MNILNIKLSQLIFISISLTNLFPIDNIPLKYDWETDEAYARRIQEYYDKQSENQLAYKYEKSDIEYAKKASKISETVRKIKKIIDLTDEFLKTKLWDHPARSYIFNFFNYKKNPYEFRIEENDYAILAIGCGSFWEKLNPYDKNLLNRYYQKLTDKSKLKFNNKNSHRLDENQKDIFLKAITIIYVNEYLEGEEANNKIKSMNPGNNSFKEIIPTALAHSPQGSGNILRQFQLMLYFLTKSHKNELDSYIKELEKI